MCYSRRHPRDLQQPSTQAILAVSKDISTAYYAIGFVLQRMYQNDIDDAELIKRAQKAVKYSFAALEEDGQTGTA